MEKLKNVIVENKIGSEREQLSEEERESEKSTVERTRRRRRREVLPR